MSLNLATILSNIIILLVAFPINEFAHAWAATAYGDDTPKIYGRLTLNPLKHLDIMGSLMLLIAGFGWAKPVPVNGYVLERRSRSAMMWVALAGPLSNLALALLAAIPFRVGLLSLQTIQFTATIPSPGQFLFYFVYINLLLAFFNLIPLAPLDGEKVRLLMFPKFKGNDWYVFVFTASEFVGELIESSPEGRLAWVDDNKLASLNLWESDHIFFPWIAEGKFFSARFDYVGDVMQGYEVVFH